jgi:acetolactate synthase-1/2/3 large subunit
MVEVPVNLYLTRHEVEESALHAPEPWLAPIATAEELERAAQWLTGESARPLIYVGYGAAGAGEALVGLAERLGAPVATTIQGKGVFPESHPLFLWNGFGNSAPPFAREVAARCDRLLAIGCRFSEVGTGGYGLTLPGPILHVDINAEVLGRNFPAELAIHAEAGTFVHQLLSRLGGTAEAGAGGGADPRARIAEGHTGVLKEWEANRSEDGVSPPFLLRRLHEVLGPETIFTTDSGNGTFLAMECLRLERPGRFLAPVDYSCMGYAIPAAIGAKLGRPAAPVVALAGDGALLMTGLEALTAATEGIPVAIVVLRDKELAQISQFQRTAFNRSVASALPDYDLAGLASGLGIEYLTCKSDTEVDSILDRTAAILAEGRPVIVDAAVDYTLKTYFTKGVVKTMLGRLPWKDRIRFVGRAVVRHVSGASFGGDARE